MNRRVYIFILLALCLYTSPASFGQGNLDQRVGELSQQISKEMMENQKKTIAVVEFTNLRGESTECGRFLAEELITRLFQTRRFRVIERQLLNKVIAEQNLRLRGVVDPTSAKQLGKILGVEAIVTGTITDLALSLRVNARLISTETSEIFAVASTELLKDESVSRLCSLSGISPAPTTDESLPKVKTIDIRMEPVESTNKNDPANPMLYFWVTRIEIGKTNTTLTMAAKSSDPERGCYLYAPIMQSKPNDAPLEPQFQPAYIVDQDGTSYSFVAQRGIDFSVYPTTSWTRLFVHLIPPAVTAKFQILFKPMSESTSLRRLKLYYDQFGLVDIPLPH